MISCKSVLNRVYNFVRVCPNYKQGIACPKQGNKIEVVVLNGVCILGFFCPKQGQGFKPSAAHLYPNMGRVPPPLGVIYDNSSTFSSQAKKFIHNSVAYMKSSLCVNVWLNSTNFKFNTNPHLLSISVFKTCMSH